MPEVLVLVVKRFDSMGNKSDAEMNLNNKLSIANLSFELAGLIEHIGKDCEQGHYVSYAKDQRGKWRLYDDEKVKVVTENEVLARKAYILFYEREKEKEEDDDSEVLRRKRKRVDRAYLNPVFKRVLRSQSFVA